MSLVLSLVPARGGSKGLPGKNIRPLHGKSLLGYAAEAARGSRVVDRMVLSTDSEEIAAAGRAVGLETPFMRPATLAQDDTAMLPVVAHAVDALAAEGWVAEIIVLLQPTSPLRSAAHIRRSVALLRETGADSVVSVLKLPRHLSPDYVMSVEAGRLVAFLPEGERITRRQDARQAYVRDGTVYTFWRRTLAEKGSLYGDDCRPMIVPPHESVTIDGPEDWAEAERRILDHS
jgi:CMP-N,N'-diacetyllegionaminic acid synthase